jgi:hypothetical protein
MRNLTSLLSDKLQKIWLCRHTFIAISPLVEIGNTVAHTDTKQYLWTPICSEDFLSVWIDCSYETSDKTFLPHENVCLNLAMSY